MNCQGAEIVIPETRFTRNALLNLSGQVLPLLVAFFSIPRFIAELGTERFGVLTLAWMVIGYFSLFDLGLGRALTRLVAEKLGAGKHAEIPALIWTGLISMVCLGLSGMLLGIPFVPWVVQSGLQIPQDLQNETLNAFYVILPSIPLVIASTGLFGILEAYHRFDLSSAVRSSLGIYTFAAPLVGLLFTRDLSCVIGILIAGRVLAGAVLLFFCIRLVPQLKSGIGFRRDIFQPLMHFGFWMTISNMIGPMMVYLDRFWISAAISVAAVAYYTTPFEVVTRLLIIPGAVAGVLYPAFSMNLIQDRNHARALFGKGIRYVFLSVFPIVTLIVLFAGKGLRWWLNAEFAQNSTHVLQWLAVGVLFNSLAQIPFVLLQGAGRPDITARIHLIELPCYLLALWFLVSKAGINGAAMAWCARSMLDAGLLFAMAYRYVWSDAR
jgi:O-antigen/teichoic acid export membrane protein